MRISFFVISLILGILAIVMHFNATITGMTGMNVGTYTAMVPVGEFWLAFIAWFLLIIRYLK